MTTRKVTTMSVEIGLSVMDEMIAANPERVKEALAKYTAAQPKTNKVECSLDLSQAIPRQAIDNTQERFLCICLDNRNNVKEIIELFKGGMDGVSVDPRILFRAVLAVEGCARFAIAHNHPSGDSTPSQEDKAITKRLAEGAKILGLPLLDHVIFTSDENVYTSLRDLGLIIS